MNTEGNVFDLSVINTGSGNQFHKSIADPNEVYVYLSLLWMEFKTISCDELYWFINTLERSKVQNNCQQIGNIGRYFYQSILSNFRQNLIESDFNVQDSSSVNDLSNNSNSTNIHDSSNVSDLYLVSQ